MKRSWLIVMIGWAVLIGWVHPTGFPSTWRGPDADASQPSLSQLSPSTPVIRLQRAIRRILRRPPFATTRWGILIESLDRRRVLFSHQAHRLFIPASNMKLYTTAAALVHLGPTYRFRTSVFVTAPPDAQGIIHGDVILYGRGDPNLSTRARGQSRLTPLENLVDQLLAAGVRSIHGNLIGDESYFSDPPLGVGWEWDDLQWYYGAEISALSIDDNAVEVAVLPGSAPGEPARVFIRPETSYVTLINKAITVSPGTKQDIGVHRGLEDNTIEVWGEVPFDGQGFHGYVAVHQPALYAATLFREALARRGIEITGRTIRADATYRQTHPLDMSQLTELAFVESIPLADEVRIVNKTSQNLHAELLLRTLGAVVGGEGTARRGLDVVRRLLRSARAWRRGITLQDGSGLSRHNLVTPATTVDLLRYMYRNAHRKPFLDSLPLAGRDGTLESRMMGTLAEGRVRAKTGTLTYTSTLSGYVTTAGGEHLVFSIMANNHTGRLSDVMDAIDEICTLLAQFDGR